MQAILRLLRSYGSIGTIIANTIVFLTTSWVVVVSVTGGLIAGTWVAAFELFQRPAVQIGIGVFLAILWTFIGVLTLIDRKNPRMVRSQPDYRYGLTFEGLVPNIDTNFEDDWFQLGFQVRNFSQNPIRYTIEHLDVRIGTRALPKSDVTVSGYLGRGSGRVSSGAPFKKDDVKEFFGKRVQGTAEISIIYGHPDRPPERRLRIKMGLTVGFTPDTMPQLTFGGNIIEEHDESISIQQ